ncbi:AAA family ATPase [Nostoc sp. PCC 7107]|uniref:AAA family ATPase n=1 Tax=Nostoc sp. PCC 7107 TaxID=317936 RepID=UPI00029EE00A|nr:AAA family ATPase [Nostoc sp. PCC 7107]AFY44838.1 hypothetical protein Nos7107_4292 [Nostoc sp. PCC 7107]
MPNYLKRIEAIGIHKRFDITHDFSPGVNILHGVNGSGKTTLIHIITNILNGDYERFLYIDFFRIRIWYDDDNFITLLKENSNDGETQAINVFVNQDRRGIKINKQINEFVEESKLELTKRYAQQKVILGVAYFPAFRMMIEAWQSSEENISIDQDKTTKFARKIFGEFTPKINYPSPKDIEQSLIYEIQEIKNKLSVLDRQVMAQVSIEFISDSIKNNFQHNLEKPEIIFSKIKSLFQKIQSYPISEESYMSSNEIYINIRNLLDLHRENEDRQLTLFLSIYYDSLEKIATKLKEEYFNIDKFLSAVNSFLESKKLTIFRGIQKEDNTLIKIIFDDGSILNGLGLDTLSSGERQIVTILYAATYMSDEKLIMIDEPEISLHIDWQRNLLKKMSEQLHERQVIACTHSPMIPTDYDDYLREIGITTTDQNLWGLDEEDDDNDNNDFDEYDFIVDDQEIS